MNFKLLAQDRQVSRHGNWAENIGPHENRVLMSSRIQKPRTAGDKLGLVRNGIWNTLSIISDLISLSIFLSHGPHGLLLFLLIFCLSCTLDLPIPSLFSQFVFYTSWLPLPYGSCCFHNLELPWFLHPNSTSEGLNLPYIFIFEKKTL